MGRRLRLNLTREQVKWVGEVATERAGVAATPELRERAAGVARASRRALEYDVRTKTPHATEAEDP